MIEAKSAIDKHGITSINSLDIELNKELLVLNEGLLDISNQIQPPCSAKSTQTNSFSSKMYRDAMPNSIDDWQAGLLQVADSSYAQRGQFTRSVEQWLSQYPTASAIEQMALSRKLATAYQQLGMYREALQILDTGFKTADTQQVVEEQVLILSQLSDVWLSAGDWLEANVLVMKAVQLASEAQDARLQAYAAQAEGNMLVVAHFYPAGVESLLKQQPDNTTIQATYQATALEAYRKAMRFAKQADETELHVAAALNALFIELNVMQTDTDLLSHVWQTLQELPDSSVKTRHLLSLAVFLESFLEHSQAPASIWIQRLAKAYQQAAEIAEQAGDMRGASLAYGRWGRWYQLDGQTAQSPFFCTASL